MKTNKLLILAILILMRQFNVDNCIRLDDFLNNYLTIISECFLNLRDGKVGQSIGKGNFGTVYKCDVELPDKKKFKIAMKHMKTNEKNKVASIMEIKVLQEIGKIKSVFLPFYYGCIYDEKNKNLYALMEHFDSEFNLNFLCNKPEYKQLRCSSSSNNFYYKIEILYGIAAAFNELHKKGLGHFDIKPSNLMIKYGVPIVKPIDFGLAYLVEPSKMTKPNKDFNELPWISRGTPLYMDPSSPGFKSANLKSDVYSLGITFIEIMFPFLGKSGYHGYQDKATRDHEFTIMLNNQIKILNQQSNNLNKSRARFYEMLKSMIATQIGNRPTMETVKTILMEILNQGLPKSAFLVDKDILDIYQKQYDTELGSNIFIRR